MADTKCLRCCGFFVLFLVAAAVSLWLWLGQPNREEIGEILDDIGENIRDFGDFSDVLGNLTDFVDEWRNDPFQGNTTIEKRWFNRGNGLSLELQNALDDTWTDEFEKAVFDWDNGTPDALTLTTKKVELDRVCSQVNGVMKVCNGNYGNTGWLGINEILSNPITNIIQSSVAKMNEYYLLNAGYDERLYTMCHEIGHGFGLPHTDENFYNLDKGDCLDYTSFPSNNLDPGTVNFQKLADAYGTVGGRRRSLQPVVNELSAGQRAAYDRAMDELYRELTGKNRNREESTWRMLRSYEGGRHYTRRLASDLQLEVHVLHPIQD